VLGTSAATTVNVVAGLNAFHVGNLANSLADLHGTLTIPKAYTLQVNDQGTSSAQTYILTGSSLTRSGAQINYGAVVALTVNGGSGPGSSSFAIQGTSAPQTFVVTGAGHDSVTLTGNAANVSLFIYNGGGADDVMLGGGTVSSLHGGISIPDYARQLTINDRNDTSDRSITINDFSSSGLFNTGLSYAALREDVYLGSGRNTVDVHGASAVGQLTIHGNTNVDNVTVETATNIYTSTVRFEGQGTDSLTIDDSTDSASTRYTLTDSSVSRIYPIQTTVQYVGVGSVVFHGGQGDDVFKVLASPTGTALTLDGGGGVNTLDYTAYPGGVVVDLAAGTATGFAGGISNIANVFGSVFADRLTGNALGNVLLGSGGRDTLDGGAGSDLLIAGTTSYEALPNDLVFILREWARTDAGYDQKVTDLTSGGGLNGSRLLSAANVFGDASGSTLLGGDGLDWFFARVPGDATDADGVNEVVTPLP
jgi:hypothetical protein